MDSLLAVAEGPWPIKIRDADGKALEFEDFEKYLGW